MQDLIVEALQSLKVPIDSVTPDPQNVRQHPESNRKAISKSLQGFQQRKPIVVNKRTMTIEAGNGLWQEMKALGATEIAVVFVEDTDEQAKAFGIMDNRSAELAEWDSPQLKNLLESLDTGAFDMDLTGFDSKALEELLTQFHVDGIDAPHLNDGDRAPFQQMTFTLHDEQVEEVKAAISKAQKNGAGQSAVNENSNGNALAYICGVFNHG
jgi:ParB family chromosome partitioning protein